MADIPDDTKNFTILLTAPAAPAITCDQPTPHQPSGCALLLWSDTSGDGIINTTNTAKIQLANGEITQEEFDFIERAVNAGSINAICPGCYGAALAKGRIVNLTYPATVEHMAAFDVDASTENIGGGSGTFRMDWYIDGSLVGKGAPFTLAAGATSEDKIDPWLAAPGSGTSMAISVKCIRIT